jgi:hypothetical protein
MTSQATPAASGARCPPWSRPGEAIRLLARGVTLRRCVPVAAVVWLLLVSSYSYLTAPGCRAVVTGTGPADTSLRARGAPRPLWRPAARAGNVIGLTDAARMG